MAELVDALVSGTSGRKAVEVRVFSRAPSPHSRRAAVLYAQLSRRDDETIQLHQGDLPDGLDLGAAVAVDTETMGLNPRRDRLCLVQLSAATALPSRPVRAPGGYAAPRLRRCWPIRDAQALPFRPLRHRGAPALSRRVTRAGLLHQDRLAARAHLYRPARAQGPGARSCWASRSPSSSRARTGAPASLSGRSSLCRLRRAPPARAQARARRHAGARGPRASSPRACFDFLPDRAELDLAGWAEQDIFAH